MTAIQVPAVLTRREIDELGVTRGELRGLVRAGHWQPIRGGYATRPVGEWQPADHWRAALIAVGGRVALSHTTAAKAHGWELLQEDERIHVAVARNRSGAQGAGIEVHRRTLGPGDMCEVDRFTLTSPVRTVLDVAALLPFTDAVVVADSALRKRSVESNELVAGLAASRYWPDHPRVAAVLAACDNRAGSVPETVARLAFADGGLPKPVSQFEVFGADGRFIAVTDFAWPEYRVIVEIDGLAYHSNGVDFKRDRVRQNQLARAGWIVLRFTAWQVFHQARSMVREVAEMLAAA